MLSARIRAVSFPPAYMASSHYGSQLYSCGLLLQAKDALVVMEGRLSGTLLGVASTPSLPLSCEGQAARLISEASDHENLGRMYIWWMPWL
jgi:hypothetical protein